MAVPGSIATAKAPAFATGLLLLSAGARRVRVALLALASLSLLAAATRAEVWEFDRKGNVLRAPAEPAAPSRHRPLAAQRENPRSDGPRAIYEPMAEGVAEVYAADPAVAGAGLDEEAFVRLFVALIDQESRFNPRAVSPKGARGLGQLMPETAALLGVDAAEPMANLHGAARYLTAQLAAFGRVDLALAAYNAGPHRVEQFHGIPPFRETRDYVTRITAAAELAGGARPRTGRPTPAPAIAATTALDDTDVLEPAALAVPPQGIFEWKR